MLLLVENENSYVLCRPIQNFTNSMKMERMKDEKVLGFLCPVTPTGSLKILVETTWSVSFSDSGDEVIIEFQTGPHATERSG